VFYVFGMMVVVLILLVFLQWRLRRGWGRHSSGWFILNGAVKPGSR
jgi:hypothetical protein